VVIGATAIEMGDRYPVPRHGIVPGVFIQALAGETLLSGRIPASYSGIIPLLLMLLAIAAAIHLPRRKAQMIGFSGGVALVALLPLASEAWLAISFPLAPALAAATAAALLGGAVALAERSRSDRMLDPDTGLPNLRALEGAIPVQKQANIVVARIERFGSIAAGIGADAAAKLILRVADRLRLANGERPVYRIDEAGLAWVEEPGEEATLDERFEAVLALMRAPIEAGRLIDVSLTFGVAAGEGRDARQLVANAGLAAGRALQAEGRWAWFSAKDSEESARQICLLGDLDTALASGQIWNAYQPKLDLATGRVTAAEALVRWDHPERGLIRPDDFIPLIEEAGRIRVLTAHVLGQALEDALTWDRQGFPIGVAVNVSASLLADHAFIEQVGRLIQGSRLPSERVTIEVTETAAMHSPERAIAALESWRALGVGISIDDYGTGQSSLGYLQKLPATELKIDKSFVGSLGQDRRNAIMVRSTIAMAHELGIKVVAEGIEDPECLALLGDMGCDTGQGYHISRPITAGALTDFLRDRDREAA
jgi:EAL domain-containing protein (putative c-di-GMP-specific phosphodiesterase class I)/GGDEF domain-containing protein